MPDSNLTESPTAVMSPPVFNRVANYFTGQPYGNLLSTIMICGFGYWFWWSQTVGEAQKAKQIQDGMTSVMSAGQIAATQLTSQHIEANKNLAEQNSAVFKAAMDHAEKASIRREADLQFLRDLVTGKRKLEHADAKDEKPPFEFGGRDPAGPPGTF